ncbi:hypothetical protein [Streptomyces laculatispora]|nr:hypothetical protein [Streptomyces laculatispora]
MVAMLQDRAKGLGADLFAPETDAIKDHHLPNYITALEKNLTTTN